MAYRAYLPMSDGQFVVFNLGTDDALLTEAALAVEVKKGSRKAGVLIISGDPSMIMLALNKGRLPFDKEGKLPEGLRLHVLHGTITDEENKVVPSMIGGGMIETSAIPNTGNRTRFAVSEEVGVKNNFDLWLQVQGVGARLLST